MKTRLSMLVAIAALSLAGCGGGRNASAPVAPGPPPPSANTPPTDFVGFVSQQMAQTPPAFGTPPVGTDGLTTDLELGNRAAFFSLTFGSGDGLPAGTYQAAVACSQAGKAACDPAFSADLNSNLN